jgi:2-keto-4-pentenoate hydratase
VVSLIPHQAAAEHLVAARRARRPGNRLPESCRPADSEAALAIQRRVTEILGEPIGAWKAALPLPGKTRMAPIYASNIYSTSPCPVLPSGNAARIEMEIAFVLGRDLGPRATAYTEAEVRAAISETRLVLELLGGRYADAAAVSAEEKLADGMENQGLFVGPVVPGGLERKLDTFPVKIEGPDRIVLAREGSNPSGHPLAPLYWLANFLTARGEGLTAGQIVTTGSYCGVAEATLATPLRMTFGDLGVLSVEFSRIE